MKRDFKTRHFLTSAAGWEAIFLTLILTFFPWQPLCAAEDERVFNPLGLTSNQTPNTPMEQVDDDARRGQLFKYLRQQAPTWAPGLRERIRAPLNWATNNLRALGDAFGMGDDDSNVAPDESEGFLPPFFRPLSGLMRVPSAGEGEAFWMVPSYHHKGFLPFHDAMMTDLNFRERAFNDRVQFDFRPFYAQNWVSLNGYGGAELGIGLTHKGEGQPWGRIGLRFVDGASNLMDSDRGFDMNAELRFDENLTLTAGVHGTENTDLGNYVMLRWKLASFGN